MKRNFFALILLAVILTIASFVFPNSTQHADAALVVESGQIQQIIDPQTQGLDVGSAIVFKNKQWSPPDRWQNHQLILSYAPSTLDTLATPIEKTFTILGSDSNSVFIGGSIFAQAPGLSTIDLSIVSLRISDPTSSPSPQDPLDIILGQGTITNVSNFGFTVDIVPAPGLANQWRGQTLSIIPFTTARGTETQLVERVILSHQDPNNPGHLSLSTPLPTISGTQNWGDYSGKTFSIIDIETREAISNIPPSNSSDGSGDGFLPLVPQNCGGAGEPACQLGDLITLVHNILGFTIQVIAPILVVLMIAVGGFMIMTAAGNPARYKKGGEFIKWALIGYAVVLGAWLIVNFILVGTGIAKTGTFTRWFDLTG